MIPGQLQNKKLRFIKVKYKTKNPLEKEWTTVNNYTYDNDNLKQHIKQNVNYGVCGGYNNLIIIDCDLPELQSYMEKNAPNTFVVQREGGLNHYYYYCDKHNTERLIEVKDSQQIHYGDIQGRGTMVVGPNSIHPQGGVYKVIHNIPIATLDVKWLDNLISKFSNVKEAIVLQDEEKRTKNYSQIEGLPIIKVFDISKLTKNGDEYYGPHPIHGSIKTGMNFWVNPSKNIWRCFRCQSGGGVASAIAVKEQIIDCSQARGKLDKEVFKKVLNIARIKYGLKEEEREQKDIDFDGKSYEEWINEIKQQILIFLIDKKRREATEVVVKAILQKEYIYTTRHDQIPEMWIYRDGIYIPQARTYIQEFCRVVLENRYTTAFCNEVISKIETDTYIDQKDFFINEDINLVPVKNGILDLSDKKLYPFHSKYRFFNKLPVVYIPKQNCPAIKQHFKEVLSSEDDMKVIQELFGYLLYRDYKIEKAFMLTGDGRNGKGKTIELMKRFLGVDNCKNLSLQQIESDNFAMGELHNKLANLSADISSTALRETGNFKSLTGHDLISAARKYLSRIDFVNYAKLIFCANQLPITYDLTTAFFNRWVLLEFKYTFVSQREIDLLSEEEKEDIKLADPEIISKISTDEELSGLLNWALEGLDRLLEQKDFSTSTTTQEVQKKWLRKSSSINAFIMDNIDESYDDFITKKEFRHDYVSYCREHRLVVKSDKIIKRVLEDTLGITDGQITVEDNLGRKKPKYIWKGIKFKD